MIRGIAFVHARLAIFAALLLALLAGCASSPPSNPGNLCELFGEKKRWYADARNASRRWGSPIGVLMAITYQESSFRAKARPPRKKLLGVIPWRRPDAFGYAQATNATWAEYVKATDRRGADRDNFKDAIDFVGWYNHLSNQRNSIPKTDAYRLYLAYHEGHGGFSRGTFRDKAWLKEAARKVAARSEKYERQLKDCRSRLERRGRLWPF